MAPLNQIATFLATSTLLATALADTVCSSSPYRDLAFLSSYAPAQTFCASAYPKSTITSTVTITSKATTFTTTTTRPSSTTCDYVCSAFSSFSKNSPSSLSTLCSCIQTTPTATVTVTKPTTTTTTRVTTTKTTTTVPTTTTTTTTTTTVPTTTTTLPPPPPTTTTTTTTTTTEPSTTTTTTTTTETTTTTTTTDSTTTTTTTETTTTTTTTSASPSATPSTYTRIGCYSDDINSRTLKDAYFAGDNSPSICQAHCSGYQYFGLEYGSECFCGNTLYAPPATLEPDSDCNFRCNNDPNPNDTCGGNNRIEVYSLSS